MKEAKFILYGAGAAALVVVLLIAKKKIVDAGGFAGAASDAAASLGNAAVGAVGGAVSGVVSGVSNGIGIPTPAETITNVSECQAYRDANGLWASLGKCGLPALFGTTAATTTSALDVNASPVALDPNAPWDYQVPGLF